MTETTSLDLIVGRKVTRVEQTEDEITIWFADKTRIRFFHEQQCCENVWIDDVVGDWTDLLGNLLLVAEVRTEIGDETWTFYTFRCLDGSIDVRWCGTSNSNYSEKVDWEFTQRGGDET